MEFELSSYELCFYTSENIDFSFKLIIYCK